MYLIYRFVLKQLIKNYRYYGLTGKQKSQLCSVLIKLK